MEVTQKMLDYYKEMDFNKWVAFCNHNKNSPQLKELLKMTMSDYSDLESEIKDAPEPKTLSAGSEVQARIVSVRTGISDKNDCTWFSIVYDVPDDPMVSEFNDFMWELNRDKLTPKEFQRTMYRFKQFADAFGLDYSRPFSWTDDLPGLTGWLIVGVKKSDEYGEQNTVKKYIAPK